MKPLFFHLNNPWQSNKNRWLVKEYRIVGTMPFIRDDNGCQNSNFSNINSYLNISNDSPPNRHSSTNIRSPTIHNTFINPGLLDNQHLHNMESPGIADLLQHHLIFYLVEFPSGRLTVGYLENSDGFQAEGELEIGQVKAAHSIYKTRQGLYSSRNSKGFSSEYLKGISYHMGISSKNCEGISYNNQISSDSHEGTDSERFNPISMSGCGQSGSITTNLEGILKSNDDLFDLMNVFVMIEADRGLDCGRIISMVDSSEYKQLISRIDKNLVNKELHPKRIYRLASNRELRHLLVKKELETCALRDCQTRVSHSNLNMRVTYCEYQFDMNKLTFFFESESKIDFRELVKSLYKVFKVRIWMCAVEKSKNHYLKVLDKYRSYNKGK